MSDARSATGATAPWKDVNVDGVRLAYDDGGRGPTLVCLHAIGHGAGDFAPLRGLVGDRLRVVALDWPDQGNSGPDSTPASARRYADLLAGFLAATGIDRPVLLGNSIGGAAAILYAHAHPENVSGLILENSGGLAALDRLSRLAIAGMVRFFSAGARRARWYPPAFAAYYRFVLQKPAAGEQRRRIVAAGEEVAPVLAAAWRSFARPEADLRALVPQVHCPVLVAWGTGDRILELRRSLPAIRQFPNVRIEKLAVGHSAHLEAPEAFAALVSSYFDSLALQSERAISRSP